MPVLSDLAAQFAGAERPAGNLLPEETILAQAIAAARMYAGYGKLGGLDRGDVTAYTEISLSEWAVIRPLFLLYVERENALQLEASRGLGVDVFGRDSASIAADILQYEMALPTKAFFQPIITV